MVDPWWVTGIADGASSFTYSRNSGGRNLALYFAVKLTAVELPVLEALRDFFGGGSIYDVKARAPTGKGGYTKAAKYYRVSDFDTLLRVEAHFRKYPLRSRRREAFKIWKRMLILKTSGRLTRLRRAKLLALADDLSACSTRNQPWDGPKTANSA